MSISLLAIGVNTLGVICSFMSFTTKEPNNLFKWLGIIINLPTLILLVLHIYYLMS